MENRLGRSKFQYKYEDALYDFASVDMLTHSSLIPKKGNIICFRSGSKDFVSYCTYRPVKDKDCDRRQACLNQEI